MDKISVIAASPVKQMSCLGGTQVRYQGRCPKLATDVMQLRERNVIVQADLKKWRNVQVENPGKQMQKA